jgi:hypothetical protein
MCGWLWWLYSSALKLPSTADGTEFCSILNEAIREDYEDTARDAAVLCRSLNQLLVTRRQPVAGQPAMRFPPNATCWRGGGLPEEHKAWYDAHLAQKYRVPMLLATSFSEEKADEFLYFAYDKGVPTVKWEVRVDPRGETQIRYRCKHVSFITRTDLPNELEYLFAAYSVFTVLEVHWSDTPDDDTPHRIVLQAAIDNRKEPAGLPLAPWC